MERTASLQVAPDNQRRVFAIASYVQSIHHYIDPDVFDIPGDRLDRVVEIFGSDDDARGLEAMVTYGDLLFLETLVDAALEYSARPSTGSAVALGEAECREVLAWLGQSAHDLFRTVVPPLM